jgi:hypothetical protein
LLPLLDHDPDWLTTPPWQPGDDPLFALARALTHAAHRTGLGWSTSEIRSSLATDTRGLHRLATDLLAALPTLQAARLLVAIDQGEELFTTSSTTAWSGSAGSPPRRPGCPPGPG